MTRRKTWPLFLIGLPAAVAVWSGWVGLGGLCGFGLIHPLPGIADSLQLNTAITLPIGVEAYGGYALGIWADAATPERVRRFAFRSAFGSLLLGLLGQVVFHLLSAAGYTRAPWPVVVFVSCIPVAALGFGMGLHQLLVHTEADGVPVPPVSRVALLDDLASTISPALTVHHEPPRAVPAPEPLPDGPSAPEPAEPPDEAALAFLAAWDAPEPAAAGEPSPAPDDIEAEAAALFASRQDEPAPPAAVPPARTRPASPRAEWTPESVGRTWDEVAAMARTLSRNKLAEALPCSRGTADKLRERFAAPALNGVR